jgi:ATP-dependent Clp protease ATP-binding subunit ClpC
VQVQVSSEIAAIVERAVQFSMRRGQHYIGVEHLFAALMDAPETLPERVRDKHLNALFSALRETQRCAWTTALHSPTGEVFHTPRAIDATTLAQKLAQRHGRGPATGGHLLLALLTDGLSAPSRALDALGLPRGGILEDLRVELGETRPAIAGNGRGPAATAAPPAAAPQASAARRDEARPEPALYRDLREAALRGKLHPAVGRDTEMFTIHQILARKSKNNVMLVGEAGVGKTQIVEGLAHQMALDMAGPGGDTPRYRILELNLAALMSGTQYRGAFEEKVLRLLDELREAEDTVLFIDEVHLVMGAGSTDGDGMDLANLLKPALARGEIRCIGATTISEYRRFVEKDPAIERRFQMVRVDALSESASYEVLKRLRPALERHHGVRISHRAMAAAIKLTQRFMPNLNLPDKAIDVLDQACARHRLTALARKNNPEHFDSSFDPDTPDEVTPHCVRKVVSQITAIPLDELTAEERRSLTDLDKRLRKALIGQDEAVAKTVSAVKKSRAGLADPNRPDAVMLFLGPSGVGKTQLAKLLAENLFGSASHLITFDMSEYLEEHSVSKLIGAPPGYVGHEEEGRLTSAVRTHPFSIVLFDEIEKAHPRVFDIFLPIFDEGRLRDARGREVSFKNCILIMTSNIGAKLLSRDGGGDRHALLDELRRHFRPEFINRIDNIVPFYPLLAEDVRSILRLEVEALRKRLVPRQIGIRMYQRAYEHLAEIGYDPAFGARELRRAVDQHITTPIGELIVEGRFENGDMIDVLMDDAGRLEFRKGRPHSSLRGATP